MENIKKMETEVNTVHKENIRLRAECLSILEKFKEKEKECVELLQELRKSESRCGELIKIKAKSVSRFIPHTTG